jgi:V/A-type H+/Na+-transporting ATPase subunit E
MGLEKIRQAVLTEAKAEAARIIDSARKNNAHFLKSQKEAAEQDLDRLCKLRMQAIEEEYNRKLIQLKGLASKQILDKRNALLKSLFEKAKKEILGWPSEEYARMMKRLIEKAGGNQEGKIRVHPTDKDVFQKVLSELNEGRGDPRITLDQSSSLPERGGFIFVTANFEVDQTLDTMLKDIEHDMYPGIASELFPG